MPYKKRSELPEQIKDNLPAHAQDIWKDAFNNSFDNFKEHPDKMRNPDDDPEVVANKIAWSAVKRLYEKNTDGKWIKKD